MTAAADLKLMMYMYMTLTARFLGPIWGQQDPGGPYVGPINFAIWVPMESIGIKQTAMIWRSGMCDLYLDAQNNFW